MKLAVDVETGKNSRRIWSCDLESEAGGQLEPARGEVEVPGVDLKAWNWLQLGLEPWHGGLTWLGWKCDNNVTILKLRASGVRCCFYCAVRANYCRCKAICNNPMCIRECHRHHCHPGSQSEGLYWCHLTNQRLTLQGTVWSQNFLAVMRCPDWGIRLLNILEAANKTRLTIIFARPGSTDTW